MNNSTPAIALHEVSKQFTINKDGKPTIFTAVAPTTLAIESGEIFGIIGASGAGKSTLVRCVNFLEKPTTGKVIIDGTTLNDLSEKQLNTTRQKIGMIFQHFNLLHSRNAFDNIALPLELIGTPKNQIKQRVDELLALVGLTDKANHYPANLSGGQKQRVAIARALATSPKILLCDEATSALDPATTNSILDLLKEINKKLGITILLITHEMEVVKRICHKVAIMDQGKVIESGLVGDLFAHAKTPVAKDFIANTLHIGLPDEYLEKLHHNPQENDRPVVQFTFGGAVDLSIFSRVSQDFAVQFSTLNSQIDYVNGVKFGFSICEMIGEKTHILQAIEQLQTHGIDAKILGYVA